MNNLGYLDGYLLKTAGVGSLLGKLNPKRVYRSLKKLRLYQSLGDAASLNLSIFGDHPTYAAKVVRSKKLTEAAIPKQKARLKKTLKEFLIGWGGIGTGVAGVGLLNKELKDE